MIEATTSMNSTWVDAGAIDDLSIGAGTCVMVEGKQVAVFRVDQTTFRAIQNQCPHRGAAVMHQAIIADRAGEPVALCPLHKRAYHLVHGGCMEEPGAKLQVYSAVQDSGRILVGLADRT